MIRSTFIAVPKRLPVLWAKLVVYAVVSFVLMLPAVLVAFFASQAILASIHILQISFTRPGVARAVVGGAVYVMLVGIFALALGAIVRSTAGGIAAFAGDLLRAPAADERPAVELEPRDRQYLPRGPGRQLFALHHGAHTLTPLAGGLVIAGLLRRRDRDRGRAARAPRRLARTAAARLPP